MGFQAGPLGAAAGCRHRRTISGSDGCSTRWHAQQGWARLRSWTRCTTLLSPFHYGTGYGRCARLRPTDVSGRSAHRHSAYAGVIPELPSAMLQYSSTPDMALPVREDRSRDGPRHRNWVAVWWLTASRLVVAPADPSGNGNGADLPAGPQRVIEAIAAEHTEHDDSEMVRPEAGALVDLSSMDAG